MIIWTYLIVIYLFIVFIGGVLYSINRMPNLNSIRDYTILDFIVIGLFFWIWLLFFWILDRLLCFLYLVIMKLGLLRKPFDK